MMRESLSLRLNRLRFRTDRQAQLMLYFNMASFLEMKMPLVQTLDQLWLNESDDGRRSSPMSLALETWRYAVRNQSSKLSEAIVGWVPDRDRMVISAAETSGHLEDGLRAVRLVDDAARDIRTALLRAIITPVLILFVVLSMIWTFGVRLFDPIKSVAPSLIQGNAEIMSNFATALDSYGLTIFIGLAFVSLGIVVLFPYWTGKVRSKFDNFPPWSWYKLWYEAAFLISLAALTKAHITPRDALQELKAGSTPWLTERILLLWQQVSNGRTLGEALVASDLNFPEVTISRNIRAFEQRPDFGKVLDDVTKAWIQHKVFQLRQFASVLTVVGLFVSCGIIVFSGLTLFELINAISSGGFGF